MKSKYYDGTKLLSLMDINGERPEIYMCTSNRSAGKTTFFSRWAVNRFFKYNEKFMLVYRFNYELDAVADKFFKDINTLFFPEWVMWEEKRAKGVYCDLFIQKATILEEQEANREPREGLHCGYAITLNNADQIKKFSHLFSDVTRMVFDEFQSETDHYCSKEVEKLLSIHTSIARGQGEQVRYVPVIMISNPVTILNPYYTAMGIANRLRDNTKFLKGEGFVLEQGYLESAAKAQKESAFNRAFGQNKYVAYASESVYLNDNDNFIEKPKGKSRYLCTLKYDGVNYGIREFPELNIIYCDDHPDMSNPIKISVTTDDHAINYVMLSHYSLVISNLRYFFEHGCFRFKNLICKDACLSALSY